MFDYRPPDTEPEIIYSDDDLLIADKPAELLTVPGRRPEYEDSLLLRLQKEHAEILIVHRLDMSTSGLLVLARNRQSHRLLNKQFSERKVKKTYLAVVSGKLQSIRGSVNFPLICDWPNRPKQIVDQNQGKPALTHYQVLDYDESSDTSRIELTPITGRTHQLRVHMQALGHPILGDDLYADEKTYHQADRLLLHACRLEFSHPQTGEALNFWLPPPF
ncbi:tRNA pseudouridine32 synthase / 23S rRNA pseudouridine746 synthase [Malonomonas rubra DSM 5091]|uniref:Pseudouridine synthase n=1 Tax=Malonomonas rubra DSM 5091 TaxID=1122189 RepID=A0A1M6BKB7_MALRU|nr:RluA family pseudouridine synthase [Malonomonas rubra]SHI49151.1 tRNA pseudouridine32 synthase / 23S rRNA pseudouridine746 synthase [Malonomonas rubra DSM 5091]